MTVICLILLPIDQLRSHHLHKFSGYRFRIVRNCQMSPIRIIEHALIGVVYSRRVISISVECKGDRTITILFVQPEMIHGGNPSFCRIFISGLAELVEF